jgi:Rrf2 family protein
MKISYKSDYALKALLDLSLYSKNGQAVKLSEIATRQDIPEPYLEQILLLMKKGGLVLSKAGKGGGFFLSKKPEDLTLGEALRVMEGPIEPIACAVDPAYAGCRDAERCAFQEVWIRLSGAMAAVLDKVTFADLARRARELRKPALKPEYHI